MKLSQFKFKLPEDLVALEPPIVCLKTTTAQKKKYIVATSVA